MIDRRATLGLLAATPVALTAPADAAMQAVSGRAPGTPIDHFWNRCVGAGRANEGLRAGWLEQLALVHDECGFRYCRFHGLFHDDMFVYAERGGVAGYNWQYVDDLFDRMLAIGVRPFVELGFMPRDLASGTRTQFWWKGNVTPPKDFARWGDLVGAFARHCIARWGADEVRAWYFEVWNEPNLRPFWDGTRAQYFELYKVSAQALKAVDPALRVGGPATSNFVGDERFDGEVEDKAKHRTNQVADVDSLPWHGVWIEAFLAYCKAQALPVDFVSTHPYPTDFAFNPETSATRGRTRSVDSTRDDLRWLKAVVARSAFPAAEIHLTEWSSSPSSRDFTHDHVQAAAYIIKVNLDCLGLADSLAYWTFSDVFEEAGAGNAIFHGGFGLVTYQGVRKPAFHAYRMLAALGDEMLGHDRGIAITRRSADGKLVVLAYHYPQEVRSALGFGDDAQAVAMARSGRARSFALDLVDLSPGARFAVRRLDATHGNPIAAWRAIGSPASPTPRQTALLHDAAMLGSDQLNADARGQLAWRETLAPWTCVLIEEL